MELLVRVKSGLSDGKCSIAKRSVLFLSAEIAKLDLALEICTDKI